jgi:hypothetical protein
MEGECGAYGRYVKNMQGLGRALKMSITVKIQKQNINIYLAEIEGGL